MLRYLEVLKEKVNSCLLAFLVHAQCCCVPMGPQSVCGRAEQDGASTALERARPVVFEPSHCKAETSAGGFAQAVLAKTHWMNK